MPAAKHEELEITRIMRALRNAFGPKLGLRYLDALEEAADAVRERNPGYSKLAEISQWVEELIDAKHANHPHRMAMVQKHIRPEYQEPTPNLDKCGPEEAEALRRLGKVFSPTDPSALAESLAAVFLDKANPHSEGVLGLVYQEIALMQGEHDASKAGPPAPTVSELERQDTITPQGQAPATPLIGG